MFEKGLKKIFKQYNFFYQLEIEYELRKKLISNNKDDRHTAVKELLKSNIRDPISILMHIAKGKKRPFFKSYDFDDQVCAMKELLYSQKNEAQLFLKNFFKETIYFTKILTLHDMPIPFSTLEEHLFHNASGELGRRLQYNRPCYDEKYIKYSKDSLSFKDIKAHKIRKFLVEQLEC